MADVSPGSCLELRTAGIIAELFKPEDLKRPTVAAATFGALLVAESQDVNKVLALVAEILRPGGLFPGVEPSCY